MKNITGVRKKKRTDVLVLELLKKISTTKFENLVKKEL